MYETVQVSVYHCALMLLHLIMQMIIMFRRWLGPLAHMIVYFDSQLIEEASSIS